MAVPKVQRRKSTPASNFVHSLIKLRSSLARPLLAVVFALLISALLILATSEGSFINRLTSVSTAFQYLYLGSFGNLQSMSYTLVKVTALIFAGLSVAIAYRAGLFNIGAAGQLTVGTIAAGAVAFSGTSLPGWVLVPLMVIASALAGAVWGGIVGALKAWRGAHEVVTTIMLNWIAFYLAAAIVNGPLKAPRLSQQSLPLPLQAQLPFISIYYNQTLGTFLPKIPDPYMYTVDVSFFFALIALVIYWFLTRRTAFGYELRVIGQNPKAAKYAGIPVKRNLVLAMALAGAFAGLAGAFRLMGQPPYQLIGTAFKADTTGFDAIGVALLGQTNAVGMLVSALLFGGLQQAGPFMQLLARVPADITYLVQAIVLFSISIEFLPLLRRLLPKSFSRNKKEPSTPDNASESKLEMQPVKTTTKSVGQEE